MSKIAILSDIHSNLPALTAVLREVGQSGAKRIIFLGDIVGYGASPAECVEWVRKLGGEGVMGNHDVAMQAVRVTGTRNLDADWKYSGYLAGLVHSANALNEEQAAWLKHLPVTLEIPGALVAHANLANPKGFGYIADEKSAQPSLDVLKKSEYPIGFFGHTHVQEVFPDPVGDVEWLDDSRFRIPAGLACAVMVGAVGQPRHEFDRRACWVLWDPEESIVEFRKIDYKRLAAAKQIVEAGLPMESAMRLLKDEEIAVLAGWNC